VISLDSVRHANESAIDRISQLQEYLDLQLPQLLRFNQDEAVTIVDDDAVVSPMRLHVTEVLHTWPGPEPRLDNQTGQTGGPSSTSTKPI
jgi:hypothetical protein